MAVNRLALAPPGPGFYRRIAAAPFRVLMLDYDGTLAPFRVERDRATPYPGVRERVEALLAGGRSRVVVVTGRALGEIDALLGVNPPLEVWASHGWEHRGRGGEVQRFPLPESAGGWARPRAGLYRGAGAGGGERVEAGERRAALAGRAGGDRRGTRTGSAAGVVAHRGRAWTRIASVRRRP